MMSLRKAGKRLGSGLAAALTAAMLLQSVPIFAAEVSDTEAVTEEETKEAETEAEETEEAETEEAETEEAETEETEAEETEAEDAAETEAIVTTGFDMSTDYPGIVMKAGESGSFTLDFSSLTGDAYDAALSVEEIPDGWTGYFKGSSGQITKVHIPGGSTAGLEESTSGTATFNLEIPDDAAEGTYEIRLKAEGDGGSDALVLEIAVNEEETGASNFTSEYPEQQGATGTTFTFDTTIVNNRGTNQTYSLSSDAPEGWQVTFTPSSESTNVASVDVDAGGSAGLTVTVTPPENVEKGDYTISCSAVSANDTLSTELSVGITGSYGVTVSTPSGLLSLDAYANKETTVTLSITNTGNVDLENLNLSSSAPTDWEVSFDESTIDLLEAGATKEITARITPTDNVITGDYVTQISISNDATSGSASFRVSVKTSTTWGLAAIAIIVILLLVLGAIIKKYGRR